MLARRIARPLLRQIAASDSLSLAPIVSQGLNPSSVLLRNGRFPAKRCLTTEKTDATAAQELLAKQRLRRPVAPHLTIYQPQITWYLSALNRITGSVLSGGLYVFGATYLVAPLFGWHVGSMSVAAAVGAWPLLAKIAMKFSLAMPFAFHCWNGLRHLTWDTGSQMTNSKIIKTGWLVVGLTVASSALLAYL